MKILEKIPDEELVQRLQFGLQPVADEALLYLHKQVYGMVTRFINRHKGSVEDAEDVFQDGLIALYKLARQGKLAESTRVEAYLFSICKNLWYKQLHKKQETVELPAELSEVSGMEGLQLHSLMSEEWQGAIAKLLAHFGGDCQRVLLGYYYDRLSMAEIAKIMGYANEQVAKNKKSDCMKKIKGLLAEAPGFFEQLKD
jgi:RNA polymerase sigma factor (sigma-70 family)